MKITDTTVKEELKKNNSSYYDFKSKNPRAIELIKKGLVAEKVLNNNIFDEMIKKQNIKK